MAAPLACCCAGLSPQIPPPRALQAIGGALRVRPPRWLGLGLGLTYLISAYLISACLPT